MTSHAIFNCRAYVKPVDQIISCKSSSFSIHDVASQGTFPTHQTLKLNTCNIYFEANLTKVGFGNGEHNFVIIISLSHFCLILSWARLTTFWSFCLCMVTSFPKMQILAWSWCWRPPSKVENFLGLAFFATKPCTSFKCLVKNHLTQYATMQMPILHFHFNPTFIHSLSFRAILRGQKGVNGWEA